MPAPSEAAFRFSSRCALSGGVYRFAGLRHESCAGAVAKRGGVGQAPDAAVPYGHRRGARVALLRSPVLRGGKAIVSANGFVLPSKALDSEKPFMDRAGTARGAPHCRTKRDIPPSGIFISSEVPLFVCPRDERVDRLACAMLVSVGSSTPHGRN